MTMLRLFLLLSCFYFSFSLSAFSPWNVTAVFKGFATWQAWSNTQTAEFQDKLMDATCNQQYPNTKAAYQKQVLSQLIRNLPYINTAGYAVLLKCTKCDTVNNTNPDACHQNKYKNNSLDCYGRVELSTLEGVARRCVLPLADGETGGSDSTAPSRKWPIQYYNLFDNCFSNTTRAAMCVSTDTVTVLPVVAGQCKDNCMKKVGYCYCDNVCSTNGDCCPGFSFPFQCSAFMSPPRIPTVVTAPECDKKCGEKVGFCYCDSECALHGDCCVGFSYALQCPSVTPLNFTSVLFPLAPKSTAPWENRVLPPSACVGHCGEKVGYCHCDKVCENHGDCCPYFSYDLSCTQVLPLPSPSDESVVSNSCANNCAGFTGQCWCDAECADSDDCCTDFDKFCGSP